MARGGKRVSSSHNHSTCRLTNLAERAVEVLVAEVADAGEGEVAIAGKTTE
jgi:hypothetical protein